MQLNYRREKKHTAHPSQKYFHVFWLEQRKENYKKIVCFIINFSY